MALLTFEYPDEIEKQMLALQDAGKDKAIKNILANGGKKVEEEMKRQCASHRETGDMILSISTAEARKNSRGYFVVTRPKGKGTILQKNGRTRTIRNAEKLAYLHYGTTHQAATGIVTSIVRKSSKPAIEAMQRAYNEEAKI